MTAERVGLIDWDATHVDVPDLDLVLPHNAADLDDTAYDRAVQAWAAWEAAVCWDDAHALSRRIDVRAVCGPWWGPVSVGSCGADANAERPGSVWRTAGR